MKNLVVLHRCICSSELTLVANNMISNEMHEERTVSVVECKA